MGIRGVVSLLCLGLVLGACAPAPGPSSGQQDERRSSSPKSLTIALKAEPRVVYPLLGGDAGGGAASRLRLAMHRYLAGYNDRGEALPELAAELPSQEAGTWIVRPDGTMQTTYRLRRNVVWHDGTPFSARDVVFGLTVSKDPAIPVETDGIVERIARMDALDDWTVVIEWSQVYVLANALAEIETGPLPTHLLESVYRTDKERFTNLPYWGREFVGVGPYYLSEWELGSHVILKAHDAYHGGRANIDSLKFVFIDAEPAAISALLAGAVDGTFRALGFNEVMLVKDEWERAGKKPLVVTTATFWRSMEVQFRDAFRDPRLRDLDDVRVRRALLHAVDRDAMVGHLYQGQAPVSHTFIPPDDVKWGWVKDAVITYGYDPRKAQDLLADVGWRRGDDGNFANRAGEKVSIPLVVTAGQRWEQEIAITADSWRSIGIPTQEIVIPSAQARDRQTNAMYPAFKSTATALRLLGLVRAFHGEECGTEANRWVGANRGCYRNPEMDRLIDAVTTTVDQGEQQRLYRNLVRWQAEQLPGLPLYFHLEAVIFREGVTGITGDTRPNTSETWSAARWDLR